MDIPAMKQAAATIVSEQGKRWWDVYDLIDRAIDADGAFHIATSTPQAVLELIASHEALVTAAQEAIRLIEWLEIIANGDGEIYKHELRSAVVMFHARIAPALAAAGAE